MMKIKNVTMAACLSACMGIVFAGGLRAETTTPAPDKSTVKTTEKPMSDADKRAKAEDCSKKADAKKLHGSARKAFREDCKKG